MISYDFPVIILYFQWVQATLLASRVGGVQCCVVPACGGLYEQDELIRDRIRANDMLSFWPSRFFVFDDPTGVGVLPCRPRGGLVQGWESVY